MHNIYYSTYYEQTIKIKLLNDYILYYITINWYNFQTIITPYL